jgi:hypothetical protein
VTERVDNEVSNIPTTDAEDIEMKPMIEECQRTEKSYVED